MTIALETTPAGLYCAAGNFYVDPWQPVARALITHAHGDHARPGSGAYLAAADGLTLLRARLGPDATIETLPYGEPRRIGSVDVSFHPAGHVLGSAQIRIRGHDATTVASGDYKLAADPTCAPFEPLRCDVFVSESTFGLPIFRWDPPEATMQAIAAWWESNRAAGEASVLFAYALGKAQRILAGLAALAGGDALPGPVFCHGAVERISAAYREAGVRLPATRAVADTAAGTSFAGALVVAPPSAQSSLWMRRFQPCRTAFASGWMAIRGTRRRRNLDRGFVLSDHADWPAINEAIAASGAADVRVTHGYSSEVSRWLADTGRSAAALETRFEGEA
ncbi:MAG TPA: ligase-associated DNA damage response exonuclease, partial [Casimicrobiaceae bacterium]|nr:ligase-associated DNA damage response exonuclease [Casimicrobiaceae bacterium]